MQILVDVWQEVPDGSDCRRKLLCFSQNVSSRKARKPFSMLTAVCVVGRYKLMLMSGLGGGVHPPAHELMGKTDKSTPPPPN